MTTLVVEVPEGGNVKAVETFLKAMGFPFKKSKAKEEKPYNPEYVAMLKESFAQIERGEVHKVDLEEFWK